MRALLLPMLPLLCLAGCCCLSPAQAGQASQGLNIASQESIGAVEENCLRFLPPENQTYPSMDAPGASSLYSCIRETASGNNDAEICKAATAYFRDGLVLYDWCMGDFAVNRSDLGLCQKRSRALDRASCRAEIVGSYQECFSMQCDFYWPCNEQKDLCLQGYAISHKDASLCRQLQNGEYRNQCLGLVLLDKSYCEKLNGTQARDSCIRYVDNAPPRK